MPFTVPASTPQGQSTADITPDPDTKGLVQRFERMGVGRTRQRGDGPLRGAVGAFVLLERASQWLRANQLLRWLLLR